MKLRTITTRVAVAGGATALLAGGLAAIAAPAHAAEATNTYTCTNSIFGVTFDQPMTVAGELPVPQYWAGAGVAENLVQITVTAPVDPAVAGQLGAFGVSSARSDDFTLALGSSSVPIPIAGEFVADGGSTTWMAEGANQPFRTPNPGEASAVLPAAFTLIAESSAVGDVPFNCTLKEGETAQTVASIQLLQQQSGTSAKNVTVKKGKVAVVPVTVSSTSLSGPVSGGKVVAKKGSKTLATKSLKNGSAKLSLGKLPVGKHKITVTYLGIPSVAGSSDKITVTVKK